MAPLFQLREKEGRTKPKGSCKIHTEKWRKYMVLNLLWSMTWSVLITLIECTAGQQTSSIKWSGRFSIGMQGFCQGASPSVELCFRLAPFSSPVVVKKEPLAWRKTNWRSGKVSTSCKCCPTFAFATAAISFVERTSFCRRLCGSQSIYCWSWRQVVVGVQPTVSICPSFCQGRKHNTICQASAEVENFFRW